MSHAHALQMTVATECFELKEPFNITGHQMLTTDVVTVTLQSGPHIGRGEASGVFYLPHNDPPSLVRQIESVREQVESGIDRDVLLDLLPPGGARNAIDCALWDLEAKQTGRPAWRIAASSAPQPLLTTFTVSANTPEKMAMDAAGYASARAIKVKLTGEAIDADRVRAIRERRPDVWLGVDANQGLTLKSLEALLPVLVAARVQLLEQPFPVGRDGELQGLDLPIPVAADESVQCLADLPALAGRYQVVNIKLDKCGGLTEGLALAHRARDSGLSVMVGNMIGTTLAMAPAFILGQLCEVVDLDGPVFLSRDRSPAVAYEDGAIRCPESLWGYPVAQS